MLKKIIPTKNGQASCLILLIATGFILRLLLISQPGFKIDVDAWYAWAIRLNQLDLNQFYSTQIWTNYTPGYLYILKLLGALDQLFNLTPQNFYYLLKLPAILADLVLAYFISADFKSSQKLSLIAAALIIFNPMVLFNSAVWGQIDSFLTLFIYLSLRSLSRQQYWLTGTFVGFALLIKPQALVLGPIIGLYLLTHFKIKSFLQVMGTLILTTVILSLPFFFPPIRQNNLGQLVINMVNDYPYSSLFAYNVWGGLVGFWVNDQMRWQGLTLQQWGSIIFFSYLIIVGFLAVKKKLSIWALASLICLGFYFLPTRVHERYLYPSLIFLIVNFLQTANWRLFGLVITLSLVHFLNLYYVYIYYNLFFLHLSGLSYWPALYQLLDQNGRSASQISSLIFVFLAYLVIKLDHGQKTT